MSLSPFVSFQSRFLTYLLTFPRTCVHLCELCIGTAGNTEEKEEAV